MLFKNFSLHEPTTSLVLLLSLQILEISRSPCPPDNHNCRSQAQVQQGMIFQLHCSLQQMNSKNVVRRMVIEDKLYGNK
jgi:hypothetical protein